MKKKEEREFVKIYRSNVDRVYSFLTPQMQEEIAKHNSVWGKGFDFRQYLICSSKRAYIAYNAIPDNCETVVDVGGFWGVFPMTLAELGYKVTMTEALIYYSDAFNELFGFLENNGVRIVDVDLFNEDFKEKLEFDFVMLMAVLEHYPHSISDLLKRIKSTINNKGHFYVEVPNIAYWHKRKNLMKGISPLPSIETIMKSATPFTGHHHEYTMKELQFLMNFMELDIKGKFYFNYSFSTRDFRYFAKNPLSCLMFFLYPASREVLAILGQVNIK